MKFQNPSLNSVLTGRTHKPKPICSPLFQSWGHKNGNEIGLLWRNDKINSFHYHQMCTLVCLCLESKGPVNNSHIYEPRYEKTGLRGFRPGPTQTGLYSHRRWLEA